MKVLLNVMAGGGLTNRRIEDFKPSLPPELRSALDQAELLSPQALAAALASLSAADETLIIGGGDGTFHHALNALLNPQIHRPKFANLKLVFLPLGSGNSFARSYKNHYQSQWVDVGLAEWIDAMGAHHSKYFLANGSIGLLARGNAFFNAPTLLNRVLKRLSVDLANFKVFLQLLSTRVSQNLAFRKEESSVEILSFQFLKARYFAGSMSYPSMTDLPSGQFEFRTLKTESLLSKIAAFFYLSTAQETKMNFSAKWRDSKLSISSPTAFDIELDGETYRADNLTLTCLPRVLEICV